MALTKTRKIGRLLNLNSRITTLDSDFVRVVDNTVDRGGVLSVVATIDDLPGSPNTGDRALVSDTSSLYIRTTVGWSRIAMINSFNPQWITQPDSTYDLAINGTATVITMLATDSDLVPIKYIATTDSDFNQIATISHDSDKHNVFTIVPIDSEGSNSGVNVSGTVTFKASDGINIVQQLSTFSLTFSTIVAGSGKTVLLLKSDTSATDNQVDASTNGYTITERGSSLTSTPFSPYHPRGHSAYFDGTGDYLTFPAGTAGLASNEFTIEGWVYPVATTSGTQAIYTSSTNGSGYCGLRIDLTDLQNSNGTAGHFEITMGTGSGTWTILFQEVGDVTINKWYHFALVRNGATNIKFYVNGVNTYTSTAIGSLSLTSGSTVNSISLGRSYTNGTNETYYYKGYLYDFRIVRGTALYSDNFTPPSDPLTAITNTRLLVCNKGHISGYADSSTQNVVLTSYGGPTTQIFTPIDLPAPYAEADHRGSVYFGYATFTYTDQNGDGLTIATATPLNLSGDFTVECWLYETEAGSSYPMVFGTTGGAVGTNEAMLVFNYPNSNQLNFSAPSFSLAGGDLPFKQWHHIALTRASGTTRLFVNGVQKDGSSTSFTMPTGQSWVIGDRPASAAGGQYPMKGYIADARVVKGTALYTSAFVPPTTPLTAVSGTSLLTCTNKGILTDVGRGKVLPKIGTPTASNTQRKFTTSSSLYTGNGAGILSIPNGSYVLHSQGDFTVECWFYWEYFSHANKAIVAFSTNWDGTAWSPLLMNNDYPAKIGFTSGSGGGVYSASGVVNHSTWYHAAFVKNGATAKVYLDGTEVVSSNYSGFVHFGETHPMNIGAYNPNTSDYKFTGYIQDLRITQSAKYTSAFTPPTQEFTG